MNGWSKWYFLEMTHEEMLQISDGDMKWGVHFTILREYTNHCCTFCDYLGQDPRNRASCGTWIGLEVIHHLAFYEQ